MAHSKEMNFRCIHCGFHVETLFIQYSLGNIRLMKCENCRSVADGYIECEIMILLIDLVLHKSKAYHHLLNNFPKLNGVHLEGLLWKSSLSFMLLDTCIQFAMQFVLHRSNKEWVPTRCSSFPWLFGKLLLSSLFGILVFLCILYPASKYLQKSSTKAIRFNQVLLATLVSSYFKIALIAMMVWQFQVTALFIIEIFIVSSNAVALKGEESNANLDEVIAVAKQLQEGTNIRPLWGTAQMHPRYMHGAATSPEIGVYAYAAAQVKKAMEVTHYLGGENFVFWGGREGY